ncbi:SusC/RagA family TonB-linked outer membrane protein [Rhizosphaericola mali]|uniref:SusC/RagA family TonB-linked outer membrane protein n=1 Tax=Rhizosphaericola mali TaxID=2545455 RepID=A0A5P2G3M7_9BACT|nr:SusC/RagA family TonB-linked outer membrane protein [Rhizosphaericola mali]QES89807.1 SusC/RagA family TonB-linked outer membrane protein [Rhizosphaericola mali]
MRIQKGIIRALMPLGLFVSIGAFAQKKEITGTVYSGKDSLPLVGASITIPGTSIGAATNEQGQFTIQVPNSMSHILITTMGYDSKKLSINDLAKLSKIYLRENLDTAMNEVVVTAAGVRVKKIQQGFTSTTIGSKSINQARPTSLASALAGKVPGLQVMATSGGVNPSYRITLRGARSLTGNNEPLLILDNTIVTFEMLSNINPEDIDNVNVLNGSGAVALYGSQASNGALIVTTKRAKNGTSSIHLDNTLTFEHVAYMPKMQTEYGQGGSGYGTDSNGEPFYSPVENESYGPKFDGSTKDIGYALENGDQLTGPYSYFKDRSKFWQTGVSNQTNFSLSSADDKSSTYISGQFLKSSTTIAWDKFSRASIRLNGSRKIGNSNKVSINYNVGYTANRYNTTSAGSSVYDSYLNMPGNIPITMFKDWQNNEYANPNGYYNPWYQNPYFQAANNRAIQGNDYLTGSFEIHYKPLHWLEIMSNTGYTMRSYTDHAYTNSFDYTDYAKTISGGSKTNITGSDNEGSLYQDQIVQNLKALANTHIGDVTINAIVGASVQHDYQKNLNAAINGLVQSGLYNLANTLNFPSASNSQYQANQIGAYYDVQLGYKDYLFLHTTGRQDRVSVLDPDNRTFFYPSVDASYVLTKAVKAFQNINWLNNWKIRASWSKVGQVNLGPLANPFGAYSLLPVYSQGGGYPYNGVAGYQVSSSLVQADLKPEFTKGWEAGTDFSLFHGFATGSITYFSTRTTNQTVTTSISNATGFSSLLTNAGKVASQGLETQLTIVPVDNATWTVSLSGNYTYNNNKVLAIPNGLQNLQLSSSGTAGSYAIPGYQFPEIMGYDYERHNGKVVVDSKTGMPEVNPNIVALGNANARNIIGFTPSFRYKAFTLNATIEYRGGYKRFNNLGPDMDWSGMGIRTVEFNRQRFVFPNSTYQNASGAWVDNNSVVIAENGNGNGGFWTDATENMNVTSNYVTNGAFWKVREVSLVYTVPQSFLEKTKTFKSASISFVGRNLFLWMPKDNIYTDPDFSDGGTTSNGIGLTGFEYPPSRYYGFNISLNF